MSKHDVSWVLQNDYRKTFAWRYELACVLYRHHYPHKLVPNLQRLYKQLKALGYEWDNEFWVQVAKPPESDYTDAHEQG